MYTPLYIKTDNSLQKSLITVSQLIDYAKAHKLPSLTITDNNMFGVMDFYQLCLKNDIKPIIGLEVSLENNPIVLYAKNYQGYLNLIKISTINSKEPVTVSELNKYSNDLICILPYQSKNLYNQLSVMFKDIYYGFSDTKEMKTITKPNKVYMQEILYLDANDDEYMPYLEAIRNNKLVKDVIPSANKHYLKLDLDDSYLINNEQIADMCNVTIPMHNNLMPKFPNNENISSDRYLKQQCIKGLKEIFGDKVSKVYQDRLKYELNVILDMGFADYFLIVADYVNFARENNIIVGPGRGSAVGSLVSYLLRITDVDPVKYNLLFERFLNPQRISMPDIDIDFEHDKREEVINYCINKYGIKKVAPIITFGTLGAKQAIRDVAKTMDIDAADIDAFTKLFDSKKSITDNYQDNQNIKDIVMRKKEYQTILKVARKLEGLKRQTSIHAAGVVMSDHDLDEYIPLDKTHDFYTSAYDMTYLEEIGLLKMDFLAIKYLTTIHEMIDNINKQEHVNIEFDTIPLNDPKTLKIFETANTIGIFQFESEGMINFLRQLKINSMEDIFAAIALYRPGPMKNIPSYIKRKNGQEKVTYLDPCLEPMLRNTYGIMIYQEQIMQIASTMANFTLAEADILRKAMSKKKKDLLLELQDKFIKGCIQNGHDSSVAKQVYELMLKFAEYGFNRSHSVGYSIVAYKMAYLKAHYPKYFIANLLSMDINNPIKTKGYIYEAKLNNIEILPPDINLSGKHFTIEDDGIRFPLSNIKNVGTQAVDAIIIERMNGPYQDIFDFVSRTYGKSVNRKTIESLIDAGTFNNFNLNQKTLHYNLDAIINYSELIKDVSREFAIEPEITIMDNYSNAQLMYMELNVFGFYLSKHPITDIKQKYHDIVIIKDIPKYFDKNINTIVYVDKIKEITTKKGDKMAFVVGSDEISNIDIVIFNKLYQNVDIAVGDILKINGKVEKRFDQIQLVANKITKES